MAVVQSTFIVIFILELIIGNLGNGFIALVNCVDWLRRGKLSLVDRILTALAISRIGLLWSVVLSIFMLVLYPASAATGNKSRMIFAFWVVANHFSTWLATILSIYYFLKIANFSNSLFLYLKGRVKRVVSVTLLFIVVLLCMDVMLLKPFPNGSERNVSYGRRTTKLAGVSVLSTVCLSVPYTVSLAVFLLLIFSLRKHHKRMRHHGQGPRDAGTAAHVRALQMVVAFLLLYSIFFLALVVQHWSSTYLNTCLHILFFQAVGTVFPSGHSCILVLGNSKLRRAFLLGLQQLQYGLRPRPKVGELSPP
ncbi:PREDICTED: taste receptor type 2 member 14-like [Dipodomys ordii]|uniref:Taste receptor type 2 n=1 Tax=Dipodomys ordii TaxID=10020 RepID=A0A1S3FXB5_DIPOR|nr:PREDICTED: taste receptor type 2 member 14-like [Dipodomys ordii]